MADQENKDKPSLFGGKPTGGLFGAGQPKTGGLFGSKPVGSSVFGAKTDNPAGAPAFGSEKKDESKPAAGLFGTSASKPSSSLFGAGAKPTGGLFGPKSEEGKSDAPASSGGGMFGGQGSKPASSSGLFNKAADKSAPSAGLFGTATSKPAENKSVFGSKADESKPAGASTNSLFEKKTEDGAKRYVQFNLSFSEILP